MKAKILAELLNGKAEQFDKDGIWWVTVENETHRLDFEFDYSGDKLEAIQVVKKEQKEETITKFRYHSPDIDRLRDMTDNFFSNLF